MRFKRKFLLRLLIDKCPSTLTPAAVALPVGWRLTPFRWWWMLIGYGIEATEREHDPRDQGHW